MNILESTGYVDTRDKAQALIIRQIGILAKQKKIDLEDRTAEQFCAKFPELIGTTFADTNFDYSKVEEAIRITENPRLRRWYYLAIECERELERQEVVAGEDSLVREKERFYGNVN